MKLIFGAKAMMQIKVAGSGCTNCIKLVALCKEVVTENNIEAEINKITDINLFAELGVMMTPGLIINDRVISQGKIPTKSTLTHWMQDVVKL